MGVEPANAPWSRLLHALTTDDPGEFETLLSSPELAHDGYFRFLKKQEVATLFYGRLRDSGLLGLVPGKLAARLETRHIGLLESTQATLAVLKGLTTALHDAGRRCVLLKGMHVAGRYYPSADQRESWDLDILLPREEVLGSLRLLVERGFRPRHGNLLAMRFAMHCVHAIELVHDDVCVDLHWCLRNRPAYQVDYTRLWEHVMESRFGESTVCVLDDEYSVLFMTLSLFHDLEAGRAKLKSILDFHFMLSACDPHLDWDGFFDRAGQAHLLTVAANILALASCLLDGERRFPRLYGALTPHRHLLAFSGTQDVLALLTNRGQSVRNRLWAARVYPATRPGYLAWWIGTLPVRYAMGRRI